MSWSELVVGVPVGPGSMPSALSHWVQCLIPSGDDPSRGAGFRIAPREAVRHPAARPTQNLARQRPALGRDRESRPAADRCACPELASQLEALAARRFTWAGFFHRSPEFAAFLQKSARPRALRAGVFIKLRFTKLPLCSGARDLAAILRAANSGER